MLSGIVSALWLLGEIWLWGMLVISCLFLLHCLWVLISNWDWYLYGLTIDPVPKFILNEVKEWGFINPQLINVTELENVEGKPMGWFLFRFKGDGRPDWAEFGAFSLRAELKRNFKLSELRGLITLISLWPLLICAYVFDIYYFAQLAKSKQK